MKQLFIITGMDSKKYGGVELFFLELAKICNKEGIECTIIYESYPVSKAYLDDLKKVNAHIKVIPARGKRLIIAVIRMTMLFAFKRNAVVFGHFTPGAMAGMIAALLNCIPNRIQMLHNPILVGNYFAADKPTWQLKIRTFLKTMFANKILAVSSETERQYKLFLNIKSNKIDLHHLGISHYSPLSITEDQKSLIGNTDKDLVLGNVCFHAYFKGVDNVIKVFAEMTKKHGNLRLLQIGGDTSENPYTAELHQLANNLCVSDRITWIGKVDNVRDLLNEYVDIYCHFSRGEALGLVNAEAMQMGIPIVAYNAGGVGDIIKDNENGFLVKYGDIDAAADAIDILIKNPSLRKTMGDAGKSFVDNQFTLEKQTKILFQEHLFPQQHGTSQQKCI